MNDLTLMHHSFKNNAGLITLIGLAVVVMTSAAMVDRAWTVALSHQQTPGLVSFMADSMFEGEAIGANDPVLFLLLGAVAIYYVGWRWPMIKSIAAWRPQMGFVLTSALVAGVYTVHSLKWMLGRARPDLVLAQKAAFSHWFAFGPLFVTDGIFHGAFPSGHTAQTFLLMTVAYILAADPQASKQRRLIGWLWGLLALALSLAMGVTRCMTLSHWLTDVLGAIFIGGIGMHLLYFKILRIPDQSRFVARHGRPPALPSGWELIFCLHILVGFIGVMMLVIGLRGVWMGKGPWLAAIVPVGAALVWGARQKSVSLLHRVRQMLNRAAINPR